MAKTIKNDDIITIKRKTTNLQNLEEENEIQLGRLYFEASRDLKQCSIQVWIEGDIQTEEEKLQVKEQFKQQFIDFIEDSKAFGWDILDVRE